MAKRRRALVVGLSAAMLVLASCFARVVYDVASSRSNGFSDEKIAATVERGEPIVEALEAYREVHGEYPESLAMLPGTFLPPAAGVPRWEYRVEADGGFRLATFPAFSLIGDEYPFCWYRSSDGDWSWDK